MKGQWESNIFKCLVSIYMYAFPEITLLFLKQNYNVLSLSSYTQISVRDIYISRLFCCRKICGPILEIYKSLTDTWMWKLVLRPRNNQKRIHKWDFPCSVVDTTVCTFFNVLLDFAYHLNFSIILSLDPYGFYKHINCTINIQQKVCFAIRKCPHQNPDSVFSLASHSCRIHTCTYMVHRTWTGTNWCVYQHRHVHVCIVYAI